MRTRLAPGPGSASASRSQATPETVCVRSRCTARSVTGSRRLRARSMTAGPRIGTRESALRIGRVAAPDIVLGEPEVVGLVDVERVGSAHAVAEGRLAIERAAAQYRAADDEDCRAVARDDARL